MSRAGRPSARRAALSGMDGLPQLRAALDDLRQQTGDLAEVVVVNNGGRGPAIIDTRGADRDVIDGLIPGGVIAALADLDDPSPETLLESGFDVVILLHDRGAMTTSPVKVTCHWQARDQRTFAALLELKPRL